MYSILGILAEWWFKASQLRRAEIIEDPDRLGYTLIKPGDLKCPDFVPDDIMSL